MRFKNSLIRYNCLCNKIQQSTSLFYPTLYGHHNRPLNPPQHHHNHIFTGPKPNIPTSQPNHNGHKPRHHTATVLHLLRFFSPSLPTNHQARLSSMPLHAHRRHPSHSHLGRAHLAHRPRQDAARLLAPRHGRQVGFVCRGSEPHRGCG